MSRSGYSDCWDYCYDDYDIGRANLYRANVRRVIQGKKGQAILRELADALDAMPEKKLAANSFGSPEKSPCTLGCLLRSRGVDTSELNEAIGDDPDYQDDVSEEVAKVIGINRMFTAEVMWENDDNYGPETEEQRWKRMRNWVQSQLKEQDAKL